MVPQIVSPQVVDVTFHDRVERSIDGRELHEVLEIGKDYTNWVKTQIKSLQLQENIDFTVFAQKGVNPQGGRPTSEYFFTVEIAKHIALASRTPQGRRYRQALIDLENKVVDMVSSNTLDSRISSFERLLDLADRVGGDAYTEMLCREAYAALIRETSPSLKLLPETTSSHGELFQLEDLKPYMKTKFSNKQWVTYRSELGKRAKAAVEEAYPEFDADACKAKKMINGNMREVQAYPIEYIDVALSAVDSWFTKRLMVNSV